MESGKIRDHILPGISVYDNSKSIAALDQAICHPTRFSKTKNLTALRRSIEILLDVLLRVEEFEKGSDGASIKLPGSRTCDLV